MSQTSSPRRLPSRRRHRDLSVSDDNALLWQSDSRTLSSQRLDVGEPPKNLPLPIQMSVTRLDQDPGGRWAAVALRGDVDALLLDLVNPPEQHVKSGRHIRLENPHGELTSIRMSPSGDHVVGGTVGGGVVVWPVDPQNNPSVITPISHHLIHGGSVWALAIDEAGAILSGADDGSLAFSSTGPAAPAWGQFESPQRSFVADVAPDGRTAVLGCHDGSIWELDLSTRQPHRIRPANGSHALSVAFASDGRVAVGWRDGTVAIKPARASARWKTLPLQAPTDPDQRHVTSLAFDPTGMRLGIRRGVSRWQSIRLGGVNAVDHDEPTMTAYHAPTSINAIAWLPPPDGRVISFGDVFRVLADDGRVTSQPGLGVIHMTCCCVDPAGQRIHVGCKDGRIRTFDFELKLLRTSRAWVIDEAGSARGQSITAIAVGPRGDDLLTGSDRGDVTLWDAASLRQIGLVSHSHTEQSVQCLRITDGPNPTVFIHRHDGIVFDLEVGGEAVWMRLNAKETNTR